jgi:hypothetical protein
MLTALARPAWVGCPVHTSASLWHTNSDSVGVGGGGWKEGQLVPHAPDSIGFGVDSLSHAFN